MSLFTHPAFQDHEIVHLVSDRPSDMRAIIAIHSTALGPAAGGCRVWHYASDGDALRDALRLSRGMSYKNALAELPFGGGKGVMLRPDGDFDRDGWFSAFGRAVDGLGGRYVTAEDVGCMVSDMETVARQTSYVSGIGDPGDPESGGDPSPKTALGCFYGLKAAVRARLGSDTLHGVRIGVQGLGNVGWHLCEYLADEGAQLTVADIRSDMARRAADRFGATAIAPEAIIAADVDVLAPCALGAVLNQHSIPLIRARVIAGAANNQLAVDADGAALRDRNILYAPDYVINAGGIISVALEYLDTYDSDDVAQRLRRIGDRLSDLFALAARSGEPTNVIADRMAQARIDEAARHRHVGQDLSAA